MGFIAFLFPVRPRHWRQVQCLLQRVPHFNTPTATITSPTASATLVPTGRPSSGAAITLVAASESQTAGTTLVPANVPQPNTTTVPLAAVSKLKRTLLDAQNEELRWPEVTRLAYREPSKISLTFQTPFIRDLVNEMLKAFYADFAFNCAVYLPAEQLQAHVAILRQVSRRQKMPLIDERLGQDWWYGKVLTDIVRCQISASVDH